ncbi:von Willebrand factor type A domain-containing protein [Myxococcus stipitatus DSM 14675]|uniref:von Willebrand factor type A domain-containing protein n=1 Tax=Myxococcus stipitatus (strain DSM 14675 / JCM 12634 / Mx s8) TaxID=1278073 RepID=L7U218_MYXSD|nr:VWA domain-containing protein [Myxococcus stipitatus]AGC41642.1 von Willebrand factor type A domain-containing protein [Myxococcus stipitatus DSM 14675]
MKQTALAVERDGEKGREVLLLVSLEADAEAPRAPVAINLVLDISASMRGAPLHAAVHAAQALVDRAGPRDYLGLMTFDAEPEQLLPVRAMDAVAKAQLLKALSKLESGEGTALFEAVERGADAVRRVLVPGARPQVLMLTDGEPSVGPSHVSDFKTLGARIVESGVSVHALGLGRHYLPGILEALTGPSGTGHRHVDGPEGLTPAMGSLAAELFGEVASEARVYVLPSGFADLRCRHQFPSRVEGDAMSASLGAVSWAYPRWVLFTGALDSAEWSLGVTASYVEGSDTRRVPVQVTRVLPDSAQGRFVRAVSAELDMAEEEGTAWLALSRRNQTSVAEVALGKADVALAKLVRLNAPEVPPHRHLARLADLRRIIERRAAHPNALVMRRAHAEVSRITLSRVGIIPPVAAQTPWKSED